MPKTPKYHVGVKKRAMKKQAPKKDQTEMVGPPKAVAVRPAPTVTSAVANASSFASWSFSAGKGSIPSATNVSNVSKGQSTPSTVPNVGEGSKGVGKSSAKLSTPTKVYLVESSGLLWQQPDGETAFTEDGCFNTKRAANLHILALFDTYFKMETAACACVDRFVEDNNVLGEDNNLDNANFMPVSEEFPGMDLQLELNHNGLLCFERRESQCIARVRITSRTMVPKIMQSKSLPLGQGPFLNNPIGNTTSSHPYEVSTSQSPLGSKGAGGKGNGSIISSTGKGGKNAGAKIHLPDGHIYMVEFRDKSDSRWGPPPSAMSAGIFSSKEKANMCILEAWKRMHKGNSYLADEGFGKFVNSFVKRNFHLFGFKAAPTTPPIKHSGMRDTSGSEYSSDDGYSPFGTLGGFSCFDDDELNFDVQVIDGLISFCQPHEIDSKSIPTCSGSVKKMKVDETRDNKNVREFGCW